MSQSNGSSSRFTFRTRAILVGTLTLAVVGGAVLWRRTPGLTPVHARSLAARLELATGDVAVTENQGNANALSGTPLAAGSRITTGKGSRALVRTADGAAMFLRGETVIVLGERGLSVESGEVWLDAPRIDDSAIEVKLGNDSVSAEGAGLSISRQGDDVRVYVARGRSVLTSPGGRVEINAGEQGEAHGADAPKTTAVKFWQDWTGGMGDTHAGYRSVGSGSGHIYGMDPNAFSGTAPKKLGIAQQSVRAVVRDNIAETEVDQTFSNPSGQAIEGWYWFTIPADANVTSFALETNGVLVEGEVVEKREAAAKYGTAVRQGHEPALLEWVDGRTYRARIYPIPASSTRRVVLRYNELLTRVDGKTRYVYPMRSEDPARLDEFSLSVDLGANAAKMQVSTSLDARVENAGRNVSMRRSGYVPRADFQLEMTSGAKQAPVRAWRFPSGSDKADYVMMRYVPEVDFAALPRAKGELVVVVDTSAGGDAAARSLRAGVAEAILRALSDEDRFALVTLDVVPTVIYPPSGLAAATEIDIAKALEKLSDHSVGGASDIGAMFEPALARLHGTDQPAVVYVGDGAATSGETSADALLERMRRSLTGSRARFFSVGVGAGARHEVLTQLTRAGGGQYLRIDESDQTTGQALRLASAIKTPTITDLEVDLGAGLDQPFYSATGKLTRGEELFLLARTHHPLPLVAKVKGRVGGKPFSRDYPLEIEAGITTSLVPRLWASEYVRRLLGSGSTPDENQGKVLDLGLEYGLLTPYTSILALDSESAYANSGIRRRVSPLRGQRLTAITSDAEERKLGALYAGPGLVAMGCDKRTESSPAQGTTLEQSGGAKARPSAQNASSEKNVAMDSVDNAPLPAPPQSPLAALQRAVQPGVAGGASEAAFGDAVGNARSVAPAVQPQVAQRPVAQTPVAGPHAVTQPTVAQAWPPLAASAKPENAVRERPGAKSARAVESAFDGADREERAAIPSAWPAVPRAAVSRCSDAAARPLAERLVLWQKRMKRAGNAFELVSQYEIARGACELPDWRDQAALLDLVQARVDTEQGAQYLLGHFAGEREARDFVARAILRRTVDLRLAAVVSRSLFGGRVDWQKVDREILDAEKPEKRLAILQAARLTAPGDPSGDVRYVRLLAALDQKPEAIAFGRRLHDQGYLTPTLAQQLGDVLAGSDERDEALRTYSEIVEFDGGNPISRRVLGDIFLRQGWYAAAYRQYKTLTDLDAKGFLPRLRLASAAAGSGRIDEALRIERDVATGEGSPGPNDPRYWARLSSAARLGALLAEPDAAGGLGSKDAVSRKIKELSLFSGPGTLAIVTWEDLDAAALLGAADDKKETFTGEVADAAPVGVYAVLLRQGAWEKTSWAVRWKSEPMGRALPFKITRLTWDGRAFQVNVTKGRLAANERQVTI